MAARPSRPADASFDDDEPAAPPAMTDDDPIMAEPTAEPAAAPSPEPTAAAVPEPPHEGAHLAEVEVLRAEVAELQAKLLRQAAEYQNYRRRSEGDRTEAVRTGRREALLPVLDVFDDLRRSLDAAQRAAKQDAAGSTDVLTQGVELVFKKFEDALTSVGVEPIEAVGLPFSEDEHEAMMQQPGGDDVESGTVLAEIQPGYRLGDRVLRHARVIVAE